MPIRAREIVRPFAIVFTLVGAGIGALWSCTSMPGVTHEGALPELARDDAELETALERHVIELSEKLVPRNQQDPETYRAARDYLKNELEGMGYEVRLAPVETPQGRWDNVEATWKGTDAPEEVVVVGAHYDSCDDTPGADDNASGVSVGLELARIFRAIPTRRSIRFVFFANEEPPNFQHPTMGSAQYARQLSEAQVDVVMMFSLEMLGYYDDSPGSQKYPPPLSWFYPDTADFVAFVSNLDNREAVTRSIEVFRERASFPSEGFAGPDFIQGLDYSDHWSFWRVGYPAVMVTDTSFFRNAHYHEKTDTADTLDYTRMVHVTRGLRHVVEDWATR